MGRQLNFWMTQEDERSFVQRLIEDDTVWTHRALPYGENPIMHEFDVWKPIAAGQRLIVIRRSEWDLLEWEHIPKSQFPDDPHFQEWTLVGTGPSPAFEWDTCVRGANFIVRGRIYFATDWLIGDQIHVKPDEPTKWFDRLTSWLRRRGSKTQYVAQFIMPGAAKAADDGSIEIEF